MILEKDKKVMIRDIKQCENYGWKCDEESWTKLLQVLERDLLEKEGKEDE